MTRALKALPQIAEESAAVFSKAAEGAKLRQGPFFSQAEAFADEIYTTLRNGSAPDKPGILREIETGLNVLRAQSFPYVPEVIVRSSGATTHGSAFRNRIDVNLDIERVAGEVKVSMRGSPLKESSVANAASHEFVHVEQSALRWWRKADEMEIGSRPLPRQIGSLLRTDADALKFGKRSADNVPDVMSDRAFVEHILKYRDGRLLTPAQATRADKLNVSFAKSKAHAPIFQKLYDDNQRAQFIMHGQTPATDAEFAAFHDRLLSSSLPSKMASVVVEKGLLSPLPKPESGRELFQAFSKYADSTFARYVRDGYKPYRNAFHEREAHAFGNDVAAHYELRKMLGIL